MDKITLGNRIRELRESKKLTQMEFSEMIDISDKALSKIEVGRSYPKLDTFFAMSEILEVSLDNIISNITISKANLDIIIIKILNEMIRQYEPPEIVKGVNAQTEDELELCKEINQDIQNQDSEASDIVEKICRLATMRYNSCANECMDAINENIERELSIRAVKNKIDTKLLKYIAKKIVLYQGKVIEMELINGDIRKRGLEHGNEKCSI